MKVDLSVIILSYNTKRLTEECLSSLLNSLSKIKGLKIEIIVVDNGSTDGSDEMLKNFKFKNSIQFKLIINKTNAGYPKGNNQALKLAQGKYVLFLNSDVLIDNVNFSNIINYLDKNQNIGVLTVKVLLSNKTIDPASHRGFPTIWNSICYFSGLEELFRNILRLNKIFGGYHLVHLNLQKIHEIDSPTGAFYLTRKKILEKLGGFDEDFFMYGEDLDLSYRIKKLGYMIVYYPLYQVIHLKHASGLDKKDETTRNRTREYFYEAMEIFYKKHYAAKQIKIVNNGIYLFIDVLKYLHV